MRRFYLTVYLSFVGILLIFGVLVASAWFFGEDDDRGGHRSRRIQAISEFIGEAIPPAQAPPARLDAWLARMGQRFHADIAVFGPDGAPLAAYGRRLEAPDISRPAGQLRRRRHHFRADIHLPDGRWLAISHVRRKRGDRPSWLLGLALLAIAVGLGAYPVARRITGRVERLQSRVDALGRGDLTARVAIEGRDEVADLARSFNRAASRVESLVEGQRMMLASASHELRSPLARLRMGLELLATDERSEMVARLRQDIDDLDELIEELLFASRLEAGREPPQSSIVDLLALLAEEGARVEVPVSGDQAHLTGDPRLLRRLIRNLLENGLRHGGGGAVNAYLQSLPGVVRLVVEDRGPGVPESERERIFEPFYRPAGMREGHDRGVGLGLALVRRIAERHAGRAVCEGRPGGGTRFVVDFPY